MILPTACGTSCKLSSTNEVISLWNDRQGMLSFLQSAHPCLPLCIYADCWKGCELEELTVLYKCRIRQGRRVQYVKQGRTWTMRCLINSQSIQFWRAAVTQSIADASDLLWEIQGLYLQWPLLLREFFVILIALLNYHSRTALGLELKLTLLASMIFIYSVPSTAHDTTITKSVSVWAISSPVFEI